MAEGTLQKQLPLQLLHVLVDLLISKTAISRRFDIFFNFPFLSLILNGLSKSLPIRIKPPLGPLSVLCVVVVTTWQYGIGLFKKPEAISHLDVKYQLTKKHHKNLLFL